MSRTFRAGMAVAIVSAAVGGSCSVPTSDRSDSTLHRWRASIVRGHDASAANHPQVAAFTDRYGEPLCSATLVSSRVVVTAGHCLFDWTGALRKPEKVRVVIRYDKPSEAPPGDRLRVAELIVHPMYAPAAPVDEDGMGALHDLGAVVLSKSVQGVVPALVLPASRVEQVLVPGALVRIMGFGVTDLDTQDTGVLFEAMTPFMRRTSLEFLAGQPGEPDSCMGDSGGPAFISFHGKSWLVGVTSRAWRRSVLECGDGGIYSLLPSSLDWLTTVISEQRVDAGGDASVLDASVDQGSDDAAEDVPVADISTEDAPSNGGEALFDSASRAESLYDPGDAETLGGCSCFLAGRAPTNSPWESNALTWLLAVAVLLGRARSVSR